MLPVVQPHTAAHPFGQFHNLSVGMAEPEIVEPAEDQSSVF